MKNIFLRMLRLTRFVGYTAPRFAPARLWSGRGVKWHDRRGLIAAGDAAGLIDPLSGEGISAALFSGAQAGVAIAQYLGGSPITLDDYTDWVRSWGYAAYNPQGTRAEFWRMLSSS